MVVQQSVVGDPREDALVLVGHHRLLQHLAVSCRSPFSSLAQPGLLDWWESPALKSKQLRCATSEHHLYDDCQLAKIADERSKGL